MKFSLILLILLTFCLGALGQESDGASKPAGIAEIYLAKDDGTGKAGEQATGFVTTDIPIYCVVQLDSAAPVTVRMVLVAVTVPGVKTGTKVVATSYTTKDNQNRVSFTGRPAGNWVAGLYRADVYVGDAPAVSREFTIQKAAQTVKPPVTKASDKSRLAGPVKKP